MKKLFVYGAMALFSVAAVSCHGDDPMIEQEQAPVVKMTTKTISGVVYDNNGNPVAGATVTLGNGQTTTTDANGSYSFDNVEPGKHTVTISKEGSETITSDVDVPDTDNVYDATNSVVLFPNVSSAKIGNGATTSIVTTSMKGNPMSATEIVLETEAGSLPEDVNIWIEPVYNDNSKEVTRAAADEFLLGAVVKTSKPVQLQGDVTVTFKLDPSVTAVASYKELENESWKDKTATNNNGTVVIRTRDITTFGVFAPINITETRSKTDIVFTKGYWDNYGNNGNMLVDYATYTYRSGVSVQTAAVNKLMGLMIDFMARKFGATYKTLTGRYDINYQLPAGWAFKMFGSQYQYSLNIECKNTVIKGTRYDNVELWNQIRETDHNGGGSI